jgi:tetratricopeptide (TPR) repeat protein
MRHAAVLCLLALTTPALADDDTSKNLGNGYRLVIEKDGLAIRKGKQRALLTKWGVMQFTKLTTDKQKVELDVMDSTCAGSSHYSWTFAHLEARLLNASAYALHAKKSYKAAADGFAKAVAADPSWKLAAYNLASAHTLLGKPDAAIAALAPWLAAEPITTYVQVTADPELRPLLARPELQTLRSAKPGAITLTDKALDGVVAYAVDRRLVAVLHTEASWGSSGHERTLEIFDLASGARIASTPIIKWSETDNNCYAAGCELLKAARPLVAKRVELFTAMLAELGFATPKTEIAKAAWNQDETKRKAFLPRAKLGVVAARDGVARVLQGNTVLGTAKIHERLDDVVFLEEARAFVVWSFQPTGEGCDGYPETSIATIQLTYTP